MSHQICRNDTKLSRFMVTLNKRGSDKRQGNVS